MLLKVGRWYRIMNNNLYPCTVFLHYSLMTQKDASFVDLMLNRMCMYIRSYG